MIGYPDLRALLDAPIDDIIILVVIAALFFLGPSKIPELARGIGRAMGELKRGRQEVERELQRELYGSQPQAVATPTLTAVIQAAKELGVETEGRPESEIKLDIVRAMDKQESPKVISAAKVIGVGVEGVPVSDIKMNIIRAIRA